MYIYVHVYTYIYIYILIYIHTYIYVERQVWKGKLPKDVTEDQVRWHLCLPQYPVEGSPPVPTHPRERRNAERISTGRRCMPQRVAGRLPRRRAAPPAVAAALTATCRHVSAGE